MPANTINETEMKLESSDILEQRTAAVKDLFPEVFSEGKIDFEKLRLALGDDAETGRERYGLTWAGKAEAMRAVQIPSTATLVPIRHESVDWDTTQNVFIEGENLEALKLLQKSYCGKVKMIYIDPPYNTGKDFIYPDNYRDSIGEYLRLTHQALGDGQKLTTNAETSGRYHSNLLNMMYPRLLLARNLLRQDGAIFVSIDDHEVANLRTMMDEIFGPESFVAQIAVVNNLKGRNDKSHIATAHESLLIYARPEFESNGLPLSEKQESDYNQISESGTKFQWRDLRKRGGADTRAARPKLYFPIYANASTGEVALERSDAFSTEIFPRKSDGTDGAWRWGKSKVSSELKELHASHVEGRDKWNVSYRVYLENEGEARVSKPKSVWMGPEFSTDSGTKALSAIIANPPTINPKPVGLIKQIARLCLDDGDTCMDFFAGSATTAEAIYRLSEEEGVDLRFILVQLPEPIENGTFRNIAELGKERCKRVSHQIQAAHKDNLLRHTETADFGFRVFRLASSNFKTWNADYNLKSGSAIAEQLRLHTDHVLPDRAQEDILFEILLKAGYPLTSRIKEIPVAGQRAFSISEGNLVVCLEPAVVAATLRATITLQPKPVQVICLDHAFEGNDQVKTNLKLEMQAAGVEFRTV